jgi:membrane protein required for colicin V production
MMHGFDISAGLLLLIGCLWSCWRGFTREIVSLLGMMAVIILSAQAYPHVVRLLEPLTSLTWLRQTIGSSAIVLAAILAYIIVVQLVRRLLATTRPSVRQRLLGGLVGGVKAAVLMAALLILWTRLNPQAAARLTAESKVAPLLVQTAQLMIPLLPVDRRTSSTSAVYPKTRATQQPNPPGISPRDDQALRRLIRERLRDP